MRHLAIGDIHGCLEALTNLIDYVSPADDDIVITLGDYVDRGPNSKGVIDWLLDYQGHHNLVAVRGNHDIMMLAARSGDDVRSWLSVGGDATLRSYAASPESATLDNVPQQHWDFLESTVPYFTMKTHFFVHANAYPELELSEQPDYMLYWEFFGDPAPHVSGRIMVCGHSSQHSGKPLSVGHAICLDSRVFDTGWLTCLDVGTQRYWQAHTSGERRMGFLDDL